MAAAVVGCAFLILAAPHHTLLPLLVTSVAYQAFVEAFPLTVGGVFVEPTYIALAFLVTGVLLFAFRRPGPAGRAPIATEVGLFVAVLCVPALVGVVGGHELQSVLRAGRPAAFYAAFFVAWYLIRSECQVRWVMWAVAYLGLLAGGYLVLSRLMGWQWSNGMSLVELSSGVVSRGYGWWSAMPWYVYSSLILMAFAVHSREPRRVRMWALAGSALMLVAVISTFVRGDFVGFLGGAAVVSLSAVTSSDGGSVTRRRLGVMVVASFLVVAALVSFGQSVPLVRDATERITSIANPAATVTGAAGSREYRLVGIAIGWSNAVRHPFGTGYGYAQSGPTAKQLSDSQYASHGVLSWVGTYLGWVGGAFALVVMFLVALRVASRIQRASGPMNWTAVGAAAILAAMFAQGLSENVFFTFMPTYPLIPLMLVVVFRSSPKELDGHPVRVQVSSTSSMSTRLPAQSVGGK